MQKFSANKLERELISEADLGVECMLLKIYYVVDRICFLGNTEIITAVNLFQ